MTENRMPWEDAANDQQKTEVTIKFGKGLVGEPFTTKNGKEVVEVKIPNREGDTRPWESFIISPKMIHDNQFGKGVWMKLPEDGTTNLLTNTASARGHQVINQQNEDGNASVEATHFSEEVAEGTVKTAQHAKYSHKLKQYKKLEKLEHRADKEAVDQMLKEKWHPIHHPVPIYFPDGDSDRLLRKSMLPQRQEGPALEQLQKVQRRQQKKRLRLQIVHWSL